MNNFDIVKKVIDERDFKRLLAIGAPDDEYDIESKAIASKISPESSINDIAAIIVDVFSKAFGENYLIEDCIEMAIKIKNN